MKKQKSNFGLACSLLVSSIFLFSGCALFILGVGAAGGYAVSKDTIEGFAEKSMDRAWRASREVIMEEGFIKTEDKGTGKIEGEVRKSEIKIEVEQLTPQTVRIRVRARKGYQLLPDVGLANELYNKISQKMNRRLGIF